ncbi:aminodeoxychorismate lyase [Zhongshania guokunii]|uniref:Aminodeoxychorismate lyase n=1 Tax=Zhongshania guokunii TaxID=641783 RepID=A0ABV3U600_9GAMM
MSISLVNGRFASSIDIDSRGLAYGDGLFETVLVNEGRALWLGEHLQRLSRGASRLQIPCDVAAITADCERLLADFCAGDAILKIVLSRGVVGRGYSPLPAKTQRIISLLPAPASSRQHWHKGVALGICQTKLARQPLLAGIKHLNRLEQVLAAGEMQRRGYIDGLVFDEAGKLIETTRSNVFIGTAGRLFTPGLNDCGVSGIMRQQLMVAAEALGMPVKEAAIEMSVLREADEVFICNSVIGIWPVTKIECMHRAPGPICRRLQREFESHFYA